MSIWHLQLCPSDEFARTKNSIWYLSGLLSMYCLTGPQFDLLGTPPLLSGISLPGINVQAEAQLRCVTEFCSWYTYLFLTCSAFWMKCHIPLGSSWKRQIPLPITSKTDNFWCKLLHALVGTKVIKTHLHLKISKTFRIGCQGNDTFLEWICHTTCLQQMLHCYQLLMMHIHLNDMSNDVSSHN